MQKWSDTKWSPLFELACRNILIPHYNKKELIKLVDIVASTTQKNQFFYKNGLAYNCTLVVNPQLRMGNLQDCGGRGSADVKAIGGQVEHMQIGCTGVACIDI